jgi:hypothetical protein
LPNSLGEFKAYLTVLERDLLRSSVPFLEGSSLSMADLHVAWAVQAGLDSLAILNLPGFDLTFFPRVQAWLERLPKPQPETIDGSEAIEMIKSASTVASDLGFDPDDSMQLQKGDIVAIYMSDDLDRSGRAPQLGELQGLNHSEVVVQVQDGIRLHFPRRGTVIRKVR